MKNFVLLVLLLLPSYGFSKTSKELREHCLAWKRITTAQETNNFQYVKNNDGEESSLCLGYIAGVVDAINGASYDGDTFTMTGTITVGDTALLFVDFMGSHPEFNDGNAAGDVMLTLVINKKATLAKSNTIKVSGN